MLCTVCWDPSEGARTGAATANSEATSGTGSVLSLSAFGEGGRAVWASSAAGSPVGSEAGLWGRWCFSAPSCPPFPWFSAFSSSTRTLLEKTARGSVVGRAGQTQLSLNSRAWTETEPRTEHKSHSEEFINSELRDMKGKINVLICVVMIDLFISFAWK